MTKFLDNMALGVLLTTGLVAIGVVIALVIKNLWLLIFLALTALFFWAWVRLITK